MLLLTFTTLLANSADDKLIIFFLFFLRKWLRHFMQIVPLGDNLHEMPKPIFWEKIKMALAEICTQYAKR